MGHGGSANEKLRIQQIKEEVGNNENIAGLGFLVRALSFLAKNFCRVEAIIVGHLQFLMVYPLCIS